jgi:hypothetical protein
LTDESTKRCARCGSTEGPFEQHHLALRVNHDTATVWLCKGRCHNEQTARQLQAGLIDHRSTAARNPSLALLHALTEGLAGIFTAYAHRAGYEPLIRDIDRDRRATLRLLTSISDKRPGTIGPRPISNDRRRQQARNTSAPVSGVANSLQALACILPALYTAISKPPRATEAELLPGEAELLHGFTVEDAARVLTLAGADRLARGLAALEDHPRVGELAAVIERGHALGLAFNEQVAKATAADGLGEPAEIETDGLVQLGRTFYDDARAYFDFALALATDTDPADAFERFLDRQAREAAGNAGRLAS